MSDQLKCAACGHIHRGTGGTCLQCHFTVNDVEPHDPIVLHQATSPDPMTLADDLRALLKRPPRLDDSAMYQDDVADALADLVEAVTWWEIAKMRGEPIENVDAAEAKLSGALANLERQMEGNPNG